MLGTHAMQAEEAFDVVVIGAGVVGLAVARALALAGRDVVVLEAEPGLGAHASSRNSEVIHAGIYYEPGSLKAKSCVMGRRALYAYCKRKGIEHARLGKLIVAGEDAQVPMLSELFTRAQANGVDDLRWVEPLELHRLEPAVKAARALFSPSSGIIDVHAFMAALRRDAERHGARVVLGTPVLGGCARDDGVELRVGGVEPLRARCRAVVNAAGLFAQDVARHIEGVPPRSIPARYLAKGHYFVLRGKSPFSRLVYPVPDLSGLGVHVTLDLGGAARFGPDVQWVDEVDYRFDESRAAVFYPAVRSYYPDLADGCLAPGYTGIRPKLGPPGSAPHDFVVQGAEEHGVDGLINLYGIESPGLTASLALADWVTVRLRGGALP